MPAGDFTCGGAEAQAVHVQMSSGDSHCQTSPPSAVQGWPCANVPQMLELEARLAQAEVRAAELEAEGRAQHAHHLVELEQLRAEQAAEHELRKQAQARQGQQLVDVQSAQVTTGRGTVGNTSGSCVTDAMSNHCPVCAASWWPDASASVCAPETLARHPCNTQLGIAA